MAALYALAGDHSQREIHSEFSDCVDSSSNDDFPSMDGEDEGFSAKVWRILPWMKLPALLMLYLCLMMAFGLVEEDWSLGDCLYIAIVVMTTVGYGDMVPKTRNGKLYMCGLAILALVTLVATVNVAVGHLVRKSIEKMEKKLEEQSKVHFFDREKGVNRSLFRLRNASIGMVFFLICSVLVYSNSHWEEGSDRVDMYIDGLYFSLVTLTTIGFGDYTGTLPIDTSVSRVHCCVLMLVGIPFFAAWLGMVIDVMFGSSSDHAVLKHMSDLNTRKFDELKKFQRDLVEWGFFGIEENMKEDKVSQITWILFILVCNGVVSEASLRDLKSNFDELDVDHNGTIDHDDVDTWILRLQKEKDDHQ